MTRSAGPCVCEDPFSTPNPLLPAALLLGHTESVWPVDMLVHTAELAAWNPAVIITFPLS